jgi:hypothetical protein
MINYSKNKVLIYILMNKIIKIVSYWTDNVKLQIYKKIYRI